MLQVEGLTKAFGGLKAVDSLSFTLSEGELLGLIGPNGAGKTTVFNLLTGVLRGTSGKILFDNRDIFRKAPHDITALGITRTFQNIRLMKGMTLEENLKPPFHLARNYTYLDSLFLTSRYRREEERILENVHRVLARLRIDAYASVAVEDLAYGVQKKAELARALLFEPRILLLDEPAAGLNPAETDEMIEIVRDLHKNSSMGIIVVEHNMKVIMGISDRILVMNQGKPIAEGSPLEIQKNPQVLKAYLGERAWKKQALQGQ